jgi:hypothetical protein
MIAASDPATPTTITPNAASGKNVYDGHSSATDGRIGVTVRV